MVSIILSSVEQIFNTGFRRAQGGESDGEQRPALTPYPLSRSEAREGLLVPFSRTVGEGNER